MSGSDNRIFLLLAGAGLLGAAYFFLWYVGGIVFLFFLGIVLAYLLHPLIVRLEAKGYRRNRIVLGFYIFVIVSTLLAAELVVPLLLAGVVAQKERLAEFAQLLQTFPSTIQKNWLTRLPFGQEQAAAAIASADTWLQKSESALPAVILQSTSKLLNLLLLPVITYFALVQGPGWVNGLIRVCPNRHVEKVVSLVYQVDEVLGSYLRGLMLDCLIFAVITWTALAALGLEYALEVALLGGLLNVVPYAGPFATAGVAAALGFIQFHHGSAVARILVVMVAAKLLDDWVIQPAIFQRTVKVHPLLLMFALLVGGELFGFFGLVFAVPATVAVQAAVRVFYDWYVAETGHNTAPYTRYAARVPSL